jgi:hypothetical protein
MRSIVLLVCGAALLSCTGGAAQAGNEADTSKASSAEVTVAFPLLFDQGGTKVLATYVSHVVASGRHPLASITVRNTGGPAAFQVSIDLPGYGSPATSTVSLAAGESRTLALSPVLDFGALFQLTTAVPAALTVTVDTGSATLLRQSYPVEVSGRDTVFWTSGGESTAPLIATMVTPQDRAGSVAAVLRGAADRFPGTRLVGYQATSWPGGSYTLAPGEFRDEPIRLLAGEDAAVAIDAVAVADSGRAASDLAVFIVDDESFRAWTAGADAGACALQAASSAGTTVVCTAPGAGSYHVVYLNPGSNLTARTVTRHRAMTRYEVTYFQTRAIFEELRARGVAYLNLVGSGFFASAQNVKYPSESLASRSANCIEGALVFASAWEALGMEPVLALSFAAGHAFAAVRCWPGAEGCLVPVETTLVGSEVTFEDAVTIAAREWDEWVADGTLLQVDVAAARAAQLTPAPM